MSKLSLLAWVCTSSDLRLQELNIQLQLGNIALQIQDGDHSILSSARKQLSAFPSVQSLYVTAKNQLKEWTRMQCEDHLQLLCVQSKFQNSAELETSCQTGDGAGQLSLLLCAALDTLYLLLWWSIQPEAKCSFCDSQLQATTHVLSSCPAVLNQLQYTYRHDQVFSVLHAH